MRLLGRFFVGSLRPAGGWPPEGPLGGPSKFCCVERRVDDDGGGPEGGPCGVTVESVLFGGSGNVMPPGCDDVPLLGFFFGCCSDCVWPPGPVGETSPEGGRSWPSNLCGPCGGWPEVPEMPGGPDGIMSVLPDFDGCGSCVWLPGPVGDISPEGGRIWPEDDGGGMRPVSYLPGR